MQVGYARVSTRDQQLALQVDALRQAGCTQIYEEVISGAKAERPVLQALLTQVRAGDVLMIWKLDRLGRSLRHLIEVVTTLAQREVGFKSLHEHLDTTTSTGKLVFHLFGALAEFERDLIRERQREGIALAKQKGVYRGRRRALSVEQADELRRRAAAGEKKASLSRAFGISRETLYQYLRQSPSERTAEEIPSDSSPHRHPSAPLPSLA